MISGFLKANLSCLQVMQTLYSIRSQTITENRAGILIRESDIIFAYRDSVQLKCANNRFMAARQTSIKSKTKSIQLFVLLGGNPISHHTPYPFFLLTHWDGRCCIWPPGIA